MVGLPSITDPGLGNPDLAFWQKDLTHVSLGIRSDTDRCDRGLFFKACGEFYRLGNQANWSRLSRHPDDVRYFPVISKNCYHSGLECLKFIATLPFDVHR